MSGRRGPALPYSVVAGVTPWRARWLVASAKIVGATFAPEEPRIFDTFSEILREIPAYSAIVVNAPIGYIEQPGLERRTCDLQARSLLGRRGATVHTSPTRATLLEDCDVQNEPLDAVSTKLLPRYREVATEMSPYRQRVVYEGHPELSFYHINGNTPLTRSKNTTAGREEREALLTRRIPDIAKIIEAQLDQVPRKHLLDGAALLWTARRVFGRAAIRVPAEAEWDASGLRVEMVL